MQVKVLDRDAAQFTRTRSNDIVKVFRNADPSLHPFEQAREYKRALNAVKLEKMFAKPFLFSLDGHSDGVFCMNTVSQSLVKAVSGACDGEVRLWDLSARNTLWRAKAHTGFVRGVVSSGDGDYVVSCGTDKAVKLFPTELATLEEDDSFLDRLSHTKKNCPIQAAQATYLSAEPLIGIDHHRTKPMFATCSSKVELWDPERSDPVHSFTWGADSIQLVKFNPVEMDVVASAATDRNIVLYDTRQRTPLKKMILSMSTNALAWNPMEGFVFTAANEDKNCYTFDMRYLDRALSVHADHVGAVMSIDYAPTGAEFVTGSYDKTIRIFESNSTKSRECYHTNRMQRIFSVKFSADNAYILSGSDDTNIRVWKAKASAKVGVMLPREKRAVGYHSKLKKKFQHAPQISKIAKHTLVPRYIKSMKKNAQIIKASQHRKEQNRRRHSKPGAVPYKDKKKNSIVKLE